MRRLFTLLDALVTSWVSQVVDLRDSERPKPVGVCPATPHIKFAVITSTVQQHIDQSA